MLIGFLRRPTTQFVAVYNSFHVTKECRSDCFVILAGIVRCDRGASFKYNLAESQVEN